jgi:hypothetical protein
MRWPALGGNEVMAIVVVAAADFVAIRAGMHYGGETADRSLRIGLLVLGLLPMVNILALGLWAGHRSPGCPHFLMGFSIFMAVQSALFLAGTALIDPNFLHSYNDPIARSLQAWVLGGRPALTTKDLALFFLVMSLIYVVPQVVLASIGGSLFRLFGKSTRPPSKGRVRSAGRFLPGSKVSDIVALSVSFTASGVLSGAARRLSPGRGRRSSCRCRS